MIKTNQMWTSYAPYFINLHHSHIPKLRYNEYMNQWRTQGFSFQRGVLNCMQAVIPRQAWKGCLGGGGGGGGGGSHISSFHQQYFVSFPYG